MNPRPFIATIKILLLAPLLLVSGCGIKLVETNSTSSDALVYSEIPIDTSSPGATRFSLAKRVIFQNCVSCHQHQSWGALSSDTAFIDERLISSDGSLDTSPLYYRLAGTTDIPRGPKDMPQNQAALSSEDRDIIKNWIQKIQDPNTP